jgi:hypothetical protein
LTWGTDSGRSPNPAERRKWRRRRLGESLAGIAIAVTHRRTGGGTMRKLLVALTLVSFFVAGTALAGEFGAPAPYTKEGQFSMGLGYSYMSTDIKPKDRTIIDTDKIKISQNQVYLEGGYGIAKDWEAFARLGGADLKQKDSFIDNTLPGGKADFSDGMKFFGTLGFRGAFYSAPSYRVGMFLQGTYFSEYKDVDAAQSQVKVKSMYEVDFGIAAQTDLGPATLYAGPFVYVLRGKAEDTDLSPGGGFLGSVSFKEKTPVGGFAGVRYPFGGGYFGNLEGRYQSGGVVSVSVMKTF